MNYYDQLMIMHMGIIPHYDDVVMSVDLGDLYPLIFDEGPAAASSCRESALAGMDALPGEADQESRMEAIYSDGVEIPTGLSQEVVGFYPLRENEQIRRLSEVLYEVIQDIAMQLKKGISAPIKPRDESDHVSGGVKSTRMNIISVPSSTNGRKRTRDQLIERASVSFKLPDEFDAGIKLDELEVFHSWQPEGPGHPESQVHQDNYSSSTHQLCFIQRLEGWNIECREYADGEDEMYYYHAMSRKMLRSIEEVVDFIMFEIYPNKVMAAATSLSY